jgi:hypothetical protein
VTGRHRSPEPSRYEIRIRGRLGEMVCSAFPALQARARGEDTVLTGVLADQAALYGARAECEALGLELLELRSLDQQDDHHEAARQSSVPAPLGRPRNHPNRAIACSPRPSRGWSRKIEGRLGRA